MWIRSILTVVLGLLLTAPARAQTEARATARISINVDALGSDVRHRPLDIRGLAGSMRSLAGRSALGGSEWLDAAASRIEAHAEALEGALTARGRTLAVIRDDLAVLDAEWGALVDVLRRESDGRAWEDAVRRVLSGTSS